MLKHKIGAGFYSFKRDLDDPFSDYVNPLKRTGWVFVFGGFSSIQWGKWEGLAILLQFNSTQSVSPSIHSNALLNILLHFFGGPIYLGISAAPCRPKKNIDDRRPLPEAEVGNSRWNIGSSGAKDGWICGVPQKSVHWLLLPSRMG
jgi:hypothetical protein